MDKILSLTIGAILTLVILIGFGKRIYRRLKPRIPGTWNQGFQVIREYGKKELSRICLLSALRYLVFCSQFAILFYFLSDFEFELWQVIFIPIVFLIQSLVAVPAIADVGVRVSVTTLFYAGILSPSEITLSITALWFINLILPAIIGSLILAAINLRKS